MYQPKKYRKDDPGYIFEFIRKHPFATLIVKGEALMATHIPVLAEGTPENFRLFFHIANHNELLEFLKDGTEALLIFQGAHAYISSSWYKEKDISTWDYSAVHINAKLRIQSLKELETSLEKLVKEFEKEQEEPLYYQDIPLAMLADHLPQITGFWAEPVKVEAVAKLHQTFRKEDVLAVASELEKSGGLAAELGKDIRNENGLIQEPELREKKSTN